MVRKYVFVLKRAKFCRFSSRSLAIDLEVNFRIFFFLCGITRIAALLLEVSTCLYTQHQAHKTRTVTVGDCRPRTLSSVDRPPPPLITQE